MNSINNNAPSGVSAGANPATGNAVDFDAALSKTFQDLLKKPELDDEISGFGL